MNSEKFLVKFIDTQEGIEESISTDFVCALVNKTDTVEFIEKSHTSYGDALQVYTTGIKFLLGRIHELLAPYKDSENFTILYDYICEKVKDCIGETEFRDLLKDTD